MNFVPASSPWRRMIMPPVALTVCVMPSIGLSLSFRCTKTGMRSSTRWARRRSSDVG